MTYYDYGFRIYHPAVGRFLSVDPLRGEYPWNSPYAFAENDVIRSIDLEGLEKAIVINRYNAGNPTKTTILQVSNGTNTVNFNATGNGVSGLTLNDILEINTGARRDATFSGSEQAILAAGVDASRPVVNSLTTSGTNNQRLSAIEGFSFPGATPIQGQANQLSNSWGTWTQVPVFEDQQVQNTRTVRNVFPTTTVGDVPLAINPLSGEVSSNPTNSKGYGQVKSLFDLAKSNGVSTINVTVGMSLGSDIDQAKLASSISSSLATKFNFKGNINVSLTSVGASAGSVTISSPGASVSRQVTETTTQRVQTGTINVLDPNGN